MSQAAGMQAMLPILGVLATVKNGLYDMVIDAGLRVLDALLEQERIELCGPRFQHSRGREVVRWGYDEHAELVLGGRRVGGQAPPSALEKRQGGAVAELEAILRRGPAVDAGRRADAHRRRDP